MTKEELFRKDWWNYQEDSGQKYIIQSNVFRKLEKFFEENVCIPKGKHRHKDADVLHEWIEGAEIQQQFDETDVWHDRKETAIKQFVFRRYRIKPSEAIYEWQWYYYPCFGNGNTGVTKYMTDEVFEVCQKSRGLEYEKIEKSKRVQP